MGGSGGGREALRVARCRSPPSAPSRHLLPASGEKDARYREPLAPRKRGEGGRRPGEGLPATGNRQQATIIMSTAPLQGDIRVDVTAIEKSLSELWRGEKKEGDHAVTRAALWNVVAHTSSSDHHATASETLCRVAATV